MLVAVSLYSQDRAPISAYDAERSEVACGNIQGPTVIFNYLESPNVNRIAILGPVRLFHPFYGLGYITKAVPPKWWVMAPGLGEFFGPFSELRYIDSSKGPHGEHQAFGAEIHTRYDSSTNTLVNWLSIRNLATGEHKDAKGVTFLDWQGRPWRFKVPSVEAVSNHSGPEQLVTRLIQLP